MRNAKVVALLIVVLASVPMLAQAHHPAAEGSGASADAIWADLVAGNERFASGHAATRELVHRRESLAKSQSPKVVVLACSDSRVGPELLFDKSLGDLFVVRSAGNIADAVGRGSIEYAVEHLGSTVLVVLGHTSCGAVKAACSGEKMPSANLDAIVSHIAPVCAKPSADAHKLDPSVEGNIRKSAADVLAGSEILRHAVEHGKLTVIRAAYDIETGRVTRLD